MPGLCDVGTGKARLADRAHTLSVPCPRRNSLLRRYEKREGGVLLSAEADRGTAQGEEGVVDFGGSFVTALQLSQVSLQSRTRVQPPVGLGGSLGVSRASKAQNSPPIYGLAMSSPSPERRSYCVSRCKSSHASVVGGRRTATAAALAAISSLLSPPAMVNRLSGCDSA